MSRFKNVIVALGILFVATTANASFLIEPHLGYNISGGQSAYTSGSTTSKFAYSGPQYGARLGAQFLGVMGGFAYTHSTYELKISGGMTDQGKQKQDDLGLFVGYSAPILIRAWVAYFFSSKYTATESNSSYTSGDVSKGNTTEIGVGFTPLPLISLNLAYRMFTVKSYTDVGASSVDYNPSIKNTEIVLGVSVPFHLL
jgi:hypothetical protein